MPMGWDDALMAIGMAMQAGVDQSNNTAGRQMTEEQFRRQQAQREGQLAVETESRLNRAPLADQALALLKARMGAAPTAFQPRDYTQGVSQLQGKPTGGPTDALAANAKAAAAYTPGAGGVRTDAAEALLRKLMSSSGLDDPTTATFGSRMSLPQEKADRLNDQIVRQQVRRSRVTGPSYRPPPMVAAGEY